jgi:O-antigen/teichoic acid export membrane protein
MMLHRAVDRLAQRNGSISGTLAKTAAATLAIMIVSNILRFGFQLVYARLLTVSDYGGFILALTIAQLLAPASGLGYIQSVLAFLPAYRVKEDFGKFRGYVRRSTQVTIVTGGLVAVIACASLVVSSGSHHANVPLVLGFLLVPFLGLFLLHQEMMRAMNRVVLSYSLTTLVQPILGMAGALAIVMMTGGITASQALAVFGLAVVAVVVAQIFTLRAIFPSDLRLLPPQYETRRWSLTSGTLLFSTLFNRIIYQSDIIIVGIMLGVKSAALYAVASRIADVGLVIQDAVSSIAAPTVARLYAEDDHFALQTSVDSAVRLAFLPSLAFVVVISLGASTLLSLFGSAFSDAKTVLILLGIGNLVNAATGPCGFLLALTGHERSFAKITAPHAVLNVVLCAVLIGPLGMNGAALGSTIVMASWNVALAAYAKRELGIRSYPRLRLRRPGSRVIQSEPESDRH